VALAYGFLVRGQDALAADERADQHQQRRPGQMEVREQTIDHLEPEPRVDEDVGLRSTRTNHPVTTPRPVLERARCRRPDRDHAATLGTGDGNYGGCLLGDLVRLGIADV